MYSIIIKLFFILISVAPIFGIYFIRCIIQNNEFNFIYLFIFVFLLILNKIIIKYAKTKLEILNISLKEIYKFKSEKYKKIIFLMLYFILSFLDIKLAVLIYFILIVATQNIYINPLLNGVPYRLYLNNQDYVIIYLKKLNQKKKNIKVINIFNNIYTEK